MTWGLGGVSSVVISACYLAIAAIIVRGLIRTGQVRSNPLGIATAVIFFSCSVGHGMHGYHLLAPMDAMAGMHGGGLRAAWTLDMALWDTVTACVAVTYLALRRRFGQLLRTPAMFRDEVERETHRELGRVLEQLPEGVIVLDERGEVAQRNAVARALTDELGLDPARLGASLAEQLPALAEVARTGAPMAEQELELGGVGDDRRVLRASARRLDGVADGAEGRLVVSLQDITDQCAYRDRLHASERLHRTIVDSLHEGVIMLQTDGEMTTLNPKAAELLGVPRDELLGRRHDDPRWGAVHADGTPWPGEDHPVARAMATGVPVAPETMGIQAANGERRWLSVGAAPVFDDGRVTGSVASFVNITSLVEAERELSTLAARLTATLEGLAEGVVFYDDRLIARGCNDAAAILLRVDAEAAVGQRGMGYTGEVVDVSGTAVAFDRLPQAEASRSGCTVTGRVLGLRDGEGTRWLEVNAAPLLDQGDSAPWPVVVSMVDISDRIRRDRALLEAEQRFRSTFVSAPVGMEVLDLDGVIVEANAALGEMLGRDVEALVGRHWEQLTYAEDVAAQRRSQRRLHEEELPALRMEKRYVHADGHPLWAQLDLTVLRDADSLPVGYVGQIQDISERRRQEGQLRYLADHDVLTGLLNRRGFVDELERHVAQVARYGESGALLMIDLDHFKYVNDTLGHKAGDEVIVAVADLLRARLRRSDVIGRLGGDEFAVLLPRGTVAQAEAAAESVLRLLRERQAVLPDVGRRRRLTASVGVATIDGTTLSADEVLVNADLAMYDAKEGGRDRSARFCDAGADPKITSRVSWMERIGAALEHDRFTMMAQPICALRGGPVDLYELLLRMRGNDGELISPAAFLLVAERFDLVQDIDRWVIDHACGLLGATAADGPSLSVNVSARSLEQPEPLVEQVAAALDRSGALPSRLVLEITETAAVSQIRHARAFAEEVRRLGCRLAIDDFGAGFGSFYYLKHLPFDFLKIDGEFVTHARTSRPDAVIVSALRDMAHGLGREVIAEYCSSQEIEDYLRAEGIDYAQGFHLGRPLPAEEVLGLVTA